MLIQKLRQIAMNVITLLLITLMASVPAYADDSEATAALSEQILQVIRTHPQEILDTIVQYQQSQQDQASAAKAKTLASYQKDFTGLIAKSPTLGKRGSGRLIVEFSDFQCPFCQQAQQDLQALHQRHPDALIAYKHLPLVQIHNEAMPAAQAAWAAAQQGKFWEYHNQLFAQQQNLNDELYLQIAQNLKLDLVKFERDRQSDEAKQSISQDIKVADMLDAQGTPMFLVITKKATRIISGANIADVEAALQQV